MVYTVTGQLGIGKTAFCVCRALECLDRGGYVFANFPLFLSENQKRRFFQLGHLPQEWVKQGIMRGYSRAVAHPPIVVIIDEMSEFASQYSKPDSALMTYLRHSDKIGHTVYLISQRVSHINKNARDLASTTLYLFRILGFRMYVHISASTSDTRSYFPRPFRIERAFGHYDTAAIVTPNSIPNVIPMPYRSFKYRQKSKILNMIIYSLFALLFFLAFLSL